MIVEDALARSNRHMREKNELAKINTILAEQRVDLQWKVVVSELAVAEKSQGSTCRPKEFRKHVPPDGPPQCRDADQEAE